MKKIAVIQSNYIPWKGYFDIINLVDEFILYDDVQYTNRDWRNRNIILTPVGPQWMTIPVYHDRGMKISDVKAVDNRWRKKHWNTLTMNYARANYFEEYRSIFEKLYLKETKEKLSEINYAFIVTINRILGITTRLSWSWDYQSIGNKAERLMNFCLQAGADEYVSGPAAKGYLEEDLFKENQIKLTWMDYSGYPQYNQLFLPFVQKVTILDLIFNMGPEARNYMKSFQSHV